VHHRTCPVHQGRPTSNSSPSGNSRGDSAIIHRTVPCTPDTVRCSKEERPQELASLGNSFRLLRYNSPDMSGVHRTVRCNSGATAISAPTATCSAFIARQRAQRSGTPMLAHQTLYSTCPVRHRTDSLHQRSCLVVGAINTPTTHHSWHPSFPLLNHLQELGIQF
jgi:hypothetical protein